MHIKVYKSQAPNPKTKLFYLRTPLFILFVLLSGCTTFGGEKKKVSDLFSNVNMMVQQNQILRATIAERDNIVMELSDRLNKLADTFDAVLAERKELEKRIEKRNKDFAKQAEELKRILAKNQKVQKNLEKVRKELLNEMAEDSELKVEMNSLSSKLRASQEMTEFLGSEVMATLKMSKVYRSIVKNLNKRILTGDVVLLHNRRDISIRFPNLNMFSSGKTDPNKEGKKLLKEVAAALKEAGEIKVKVYGFTDNLPVRRTKKNKSISNNQDLSLVRAERVRDILANTMKIDPYAIEIKGYGDSHPVADNVTAIGRIKNRTVVIMARSKSPPGKEASDAFLQFEKKMESVVEKE